MCLVVVPLLYPKSVSIISLYFFDSVKCPAGTPLGPACIEKE
jgi:hypothetical protein